MEEKYEKTNVLADFFKLLLKLLLLILALGLCFLLGLYIGYAVIGDGNYWEVLNRDTWQHILDFFI